MCFLNLSELQSTHGNLYAIFQILNSYKKTNKIMHFSNTNKSKDEISRMIQSRSFLIILN